MRNPVVDMLFVRSFAIEVNESLSFSSLPTWKKRFISGNSSYIVLLPFYEEIRNLLIVQEEKCDYLFWINDIYASI